MKKALLTAAIAATLVAAPTLSTAAIAAEVPATAGVHLRLSGATRSAALTTPSGNVTVQWGHQDGPGAKRDGYFVLISRTHPAQIPTVIKTDGAGRNAIVALVRADKALLATGDASFANPAAFAKAIRAAAKHR